MGDIDEKRVHDDRRAGAVAYVASDAGLVWVALAGDRIGRFGLVRRDAVRDVAVVDGALVAAGEDVFVDGESTGFGAAVAVGGDGDGGVLAADGEGRVARHEGESWATVGDVVEPRAIDGGLVAAADGVHRVLGGALAPAGLSDVRDVAGRGPRPLAATADGLYALGNGWLDLLDGPFRAVTAAADGRATAVGDAVHVGDAREAGTAWERAALPPAVAPTDVVDVGVGPEAQYAVTADGTVVADAGGEPRTRSLGVTGVSRVAVIDEEKAVYRGGQEGRT